MTTSTTPTTTTETVATPALTVDEVLRVFPCGVCDGEECPHELMRLRRGVEYVMEINGHE